MTTAVRKSRSGGEFFGAPSLEAWFNGLRQDYTATQRTKHSQQFTGLPTGGAGADYHYRSEHQYLQLMEIARHFRRNDPIVGKGVKRLTANVVQEGFTPEAKTGDDKADKILNERWAEWANDPDQCDASRKRKFAQMEAMAFDAMVTDGDVMPVLMDSGHLRWYEAHRCRTPRGTKRNVVHGVMLNNFREPLEYWFTKEELNPYEQLTRVSDVVRVPARDKAGHRKVLHCYLEDRFSQTRGVTSLAPVIDLAGMIDDIQLAKLIQQKVVSVFAMIRKRPLDSLDDGEDDGTVEGSGASVTRELQDMFHQLGSGMMIDAMPGEEWDGFSPAVPNPEYFQHVMLILTIIAVNLDLPVQVLLLDPQKSNFSSWRGAIDQARMRFKQMQALFAGQFHEPVWRWKVRQWLADDPALERLGLAEGVNLLRHVWHPPRWDYIEPEKDAKSDALQLEKFLNSPQRIHARRGRRWEEVCVEYVTDYGKLIRAAITESEAIATEFPSLEDLPTWRDLLSLAGGTPPAAPVIEMPEEPAEEDDDAA